MGRKLIVVAFVLLFCAVIYLGAIVQAQQQAIDALVYDHRESVKIQHQLSQDIQTLRQEWQKGR
jgi:hypothetical protein